MLFQIHSINNSKLSFSGKRNQIIVLMKETEKRFKLTKLALLWFIFYETGATSSLLVQSFSPNC